MSTKGWQRSLFENRKMLDDWPETRDFDAESTVSGLNRQISVVLNKPQSRAGQRARGAIPQALCPKKEIMKKKNLYS